MIALIGQFAFCNESLIQARTTDGNFPPPTNAIKVEAKRTNSPIKIDGELNENSWSYAERVNNFYKIEPRQGSKIKYETDVRFLYDDHYLYIGAYCKDSLIINGFRVQDLRRDFEWGENDLFGIALDPQNLKQYAQVFQTTPYGNQRDFQNFNGNTFDIGWNTLWKVRTKRNNDGYSAEFAIPFKTLRYNSHNEPDSIKWGFTLVRYARRDIEVSTFPPAPQSLAPYRMTYAAQLIGLELPSPSANVRIEPYTAFQYDTEMEKSAILKIGGDLKWAINPRSILDLTVNTDFAQADLDRAVNNLERFNIFFPEQRQFFLENSGIWAGGLQESIRPFFSRRIGLQGSFNAETAPIHFGSRFTQRNEKQAIAGLFVRQGETDFSAASIFSVARYLRNYSSENNFGAMLTHRIDEESNNLGLDSYNNTTVTIDGQIRPSSQVDIQYLASASFDEKTGKEGYAGRFFIGKTTNNYYLGWVSEVISNDYNPGIGFVRQNNLIRHNPGGYLILRPKNINWIRRWDPGLFVTYNHDANPLGNFQQANIYIFPIYLWFKDNSFLLMSVTPFWQNINFNFSPLNLPIEQGQYTYTRYQFEYNTDRSKMWSVGFKYGFGGFHNGLRNTFNLSGRLAPSPYISLSFDYENNKLQGIGIHDSNLTTELFTLGSRFALNPRVQLSSFYQFNSFDEQSRLNIRFSWEYQPLSFLYIVYNSTKINELSESFNNEQFISKITLVKQF